MIGTISGVLPKSVARERNADVDEMKKSASRRRRFDQSKIAVGAPGEKVRFGDRTGRVWRRAAQTRLVIRLLVASRVNRGSLVETFGQQRDAFDAFGA